MKKPRPVIREDELVQEAAREIARHVSGSGDWLTIVFVSRNLSRYAEEELTIERPTGLDRSLAAPRMTWRKLVELRDLMYREGAGTWFSMKLTIMKRDGRVKMHADYSYDEVPQWGTAPASGLYTADLIKYPRDQDNMPDWLVERVVRARAEYPQEYEVYEQAQRKRSEPPAAPA